MKIIPIETTDAGSGGRIQWLDALKGFTALFVVLGHVLLGYIENAAFPNDNYRMVVLNDWIYVWHMPLFFSLSGFAFSLSCISQGKVLWAKVKKQVINLALIYIVFSIALGGLKMVFSGFVDNPINISEFFWTLILPNTLMWYLWVLIIYDLLFALLKPFKNRTFVWGGVYCLH